MKQDDPLYNYPFDTKPETWPLNGVFLSAIERMQRNFARRGYSWQWGLEIEFGLESVEGYSATMVPEMWGDEGIRIMSPYATPSLDLHKRLLLTPDVPSPSHDIAERLIRYVYDTNALQQYMEQTRQTKDSIVEHLRSYQKNLSSSEEAVFEHAQHNIFLAHLHLLPSRLGGLRDIIQPRFGSFGRGFGWWDDLNTAETRLPPTSGPTKFIRNFHRMIKVIYDTAEQHRVIPVMDIGTGQLHFSIWEKFHPEPNTNIMKMAWDVDVVGAEYAMHGIYAMMAEAPHLINDYDPQNLVYNIDLDASREKGHAIRQNGTSWELRRGYKSNFMHLARDIAVIMGGAHYGLLGVNCLADIKAERETGLEEAQVFAVHDKLKRYYSPFRELIEYSRLPLSLRHMELVHTHRDILREEEAGIVVPPGDLTIELSPAEERLYEWIDEIYPNVKDSLGLYLPPSAINKRVLDDLIEEIGAENTGLFVHEFDGKQYDLSSPVGWHFLLRSIEPDPYTGILNTDHLHENLRFHFDSFRIRYEEKFLKSGSFATHFGSHSLNRTLPDMAKGRAVQFAFSQDEINTITHFYTKQTAERLKSIAAQVVQQASQLFKNVEPDQGPVNTFRMAALFKGVVAAVKKEEREAGYVVNKNHAETLMGADSVETLKERENTIKMLRPHYRGVLEEFLDKKREGSRLSNYFVSVMQDTADFLDKDIFNLKYAVAGHTQAMVYAVPSALLRVSKSTVADRLMESFLPDLPENIRFALSEPHYTRDNVIAMVEEARAVALAEIEEIADGNMPKYVISDNDRQTVVSDDFAVYGEEKVREAAKEAYVFLKEFINETFDEALTGMANIPEKRPVIEPALI